VVLKEKLRNWLRFELEQEFDKHVDSRKWSPSTQIAQRNLIATWRQCFAAGAVLPLSEVGFRVFSQFEEDGILLYVLTLIGSENRIFVDLGSADGVNSNCANLAINHGWTGLFIDGDEDNIQTGRNYYSKHPHTWACPPEFVSAMICRENINELIRDAQFDGEVDLLSIDIDGNDYWVWDAIECITPRVVIIETHVEFGMHSIVVPYDREYVYPGKHPQYHGASPVAMAKLAKKKGYRLIGANNYGFNTIYVRHGIAEKVFPEVSVESVLRHPRNAKRYELFDVIKDWPYVNV
jgi:hypothetical protein